MQHRLDLPAVRAADLAAQENFFDFSVEPRLIFQFTLSTDGHGHGHGHDSRCKNAAHRSTNMYEQMAIVKKERQSGEIVNLSFCRAELKGALLGWSLANSNYTNPTSIRLHIIDQALSRFTSVREVLQDYTSFLLERNFEKNYGLIIDPPYLCARAALLDKPRAIRGSLFNGPS
jgi:hypothetical protein